MVLAAAAPSPWSCRSRLRPRSEATESGCGPESTLPADLCVLVVDDNEDAADLLSFMLEKIGLRALTATNGPQAIEIVRELQPEIVILDIGLPAWMATKWPSSSVWSPGGRTAS